MNTRGMITVKGLDLDADDDGSEVGITLARGSVKKDTANKKKKGGCCK